jgi:ASPIC and UnbV
VNSEWQYRWIQTNSGLQAQTDYIVRFGCGSNLVVDSVIINWPSGEVTHLSSLTTNQLHLITEPVSQIFTFTGTVDNSWHNASNWSSGQVPTQNYDVVIPSGKTCIINSPAICRSVKVMTGGTLQNNSDLKVIFNN